VALGGGSATPIPHSFSASSKLILEPPSSVSLSI